MIFIYCAMDCRNCRKEVLQDQPPGCRDPQESWQAGVRPLHAWARN